MSVKPLVLAALLASAALPGLASSQAMPAPAAPAATTSTTTTTTTATVPAGQSSARAAVMAACSADFKAQCPTSAPGPDLQQCVRDNFDKLSDGCRGAIMTMLAAQGGAGQR